YMPIVESLPGFRRIQGVGLLNPIDGVIMDAIPDAIGPADPRRVIHIRLNGDRILARLAKEQDVITQSWPEPGAIPFQLVKRQSLRPDADGLELWPFRDHDFPVILPSPLAHVTYRVSTKIFEANPSIPDHHGRHL